MTTLNQALKLAKIAFGPGAIKFLEMKIEQNGPDDIIIDEPGMIYVLQTLPDDWEPPNAK